MAEITIDATGISLTTIDPSIPSQHLGDRYIVVDIETGPLPDEELNDAIPAFQAKPRPGEFDPSSVKYGRMKDELKKRAKLEECIKSHEDLCARYETETEESRRKYYIEEKERAALSAITGKIICIGYGIGHEFTFDDGDGSEKVILSRFWRVFEKARKENKIIVGHHIAGFDVPFIWRRSKALDVKVPQGIISRGRLSSEHFIDTMDVWACGERQPKYTSLNSLARFLGVGGKTEDGKLFYQIWENDRDRALLYLENDIRLTSAVAYIILS